jgi:hypothetical protein
MHQNKDYIARGIAYIALANAVGQTALFPAMVMLGAGVVYLCLAITKGSL